MEGSFSGTQWGSHKGYRGMGNSGVPVEVTREERFYVKRWGRSQTIAVNQVIEKRRESSVSRGGRWLMKS